MKSNSWNISSTEGKLLLEKLLLSILHHESELTIGELGTRLKEKAGYQHLVFVRNGKRRNINQYIRKQFKGIYNFVVSRQELFVIVPISQLENQYYVSLSQNTKEKLNREEAENDDFIWISSEES